MLVGDRPRLPPPFEFEHVGFGQGLTREGASQLGPEYIPAFGGEGIGGHDAARRFAGALFGFAKEFHRRPSPRGRGRGDTVTEAGANSRHIAAPSCLQGQALSSGARRWFSTPLNFNDLWHILP